MGLQASSYKRLFRRPEEITREWLEQTFGLVDINTLERDPLVYGPVISHGNGSDQLKKWNLEGVNQGINTDQYGRIYVTLNFSTMIGRTANVILSNDAEHKKTMASGTKTFQSASGNMAIIATTPSLR